MHMQNKTSGRVQHIWKRKFKVQAYDADWEQSVRLSSICNYFQEAAWEHAEHLQVGFSDLGEDNLLWVLSRFYIEIDEYPKWTEEVLVETWPKAFDRLLALRDFELKNSEEKICARATSGWIVLDGKTKRPRRADSFPTLVQALRPTAAIDYRFGKLPPLEHPGDEYRKTILHSDIDLNNHVNNVKYIEWIIDNESRLRGTLAVKPRTLEMHYLGEGLFGQDCLLRTANTADRPDIKQYEAFRPADKAALFRAELRSH